MEIKAVKIEVPDGANVILGQAHFIKTVEDIYETLIESSPSLKFGLAFCEASGKLLIRSDGNDPELVKLAEKDALKLGCGHCFIIYIKDGYPINALNRVKNLSEVASIFAATANALQVVVAENDGGKGILGVIDGASPASVENSEDRKWRHEFLRKLGYKR